MRYAKSRLRLRFSQAVISGYIPFRSFISSHGGPVYTCFLDASKAFDKPNHDILFSILRERGCPNYIIRIIAYWYQQQKMFIKWGNDMSELLTVTTRRYSFA